MLKRLLWLTIGVGFGFGMSFWVMRFARRQAARYSPERVAGGVTAAFRSLADEVQAAVAEGRRAMREAEADLRGRLEAPPAR